MNRSAPIAMSAGSRRAGLAFVILIGTTLFLAPQAPAQPSKESYAVHVTSDHSLSRESPIEIILKDGKRPEIRVNELFASESSLTAALDIVELSRHDPEAKSGIALRISRSASVGRNTVRLSSADSSSLRTLTLLKRQVAKSNGMQSESYVTVIRQVGSARGTLRRDSRPDTLQKPRLGGTGVRVPEKR
jgi:hypothetical protein